MVKDIWCCWLWGSGPLPTQWPKVNFTVFVAKPSARDPNGRDVLATGALSQHRVRVKPSDFADTYHGSMMVRSYTPPFGPDAVFPDNTNAVHAPMCIAVTFELTTNGGEATGLGTIFGF